MLKSVITNKETEYERKERQGTEAKSAILRYSIWLGSLLRDATVVGPNVDAIISLLESGSECANMKRIGDGNSEF